MVELVSLTCCSYDASVSRFGAGIINGNGGHPNIKSLPAEISTGVKNTPSNKVPSTVFPLGPSVGFLSSFFGMKKRYSVSMGSLVYFYAIMLDSLRGNHVVENKM